MIRKESEVIVRWTFQLFSFVMKSGINEFSKLENTNPEVCVFLPRVKSGRRDTEAR